MHTAAPNPAGAPGQASAALLLRIPAPDDGWLADLPPAPDGPAITVSLTDPAAAIRLAARLIDLGYTPVGSAAAGADWRWADLLVSRAVLDDDPSWRLQVSVDGMRVFDPAFGPVRLALGPVLAAHVPQEPASDDVSEV